MASKTVCDVCKKDVQDDVALWLGYGASGHETFNPPDGIEFGRLDLCKQCAAMIEGIDNDDGYLAFMSIVKSHVEKKLKEKADAYKAANPLG